ncbi:MAG: 50S ribosomal protein L13 [Planctomycetota bacterium]
MNRQTTLATSQTADRKWVHVDADGQTLGRLSTEIAMILMGKNKPTYTPHADVGDFVVVTNSERVRVTGRKLDQKFHERYSGHPSGRKVRSLRQVLASHPERVLSESVRRMLPKNKLASAQLKKLKVYVGPNHPHQAQLPTEAAAAS